MCIVSFCIGNNYRDLTAASPPAGGSALTDAPVASFTTLPLRATQHAIRQLADEGCSSSPVERPALITKAASLDTHRGFGNMAGRRIYSQLSLPMWCLPLKQLQLFENNCGDTSLFYCIVFLPKQRALNGCNVV